MSPMVRSGWQGLRQEPRGYGDVTSVLPAMSLHSRGCARNRSRSCGVADSLKGRLRLLNTSSTAESLLFRTQIRH